MRVAAAVVGLAVVAASASADELVQRIRTDVAAQRPLVAHVVVALCDNVHQGIVPVPRALGNGQEPSSNLYWGARYGVKTYFSKAGAWRAVPCPGLPRHGVLERVVFRTLVGSAPAFVVADAWDGSRIRDAIAAFLEMASGRDVEPIVLDGVPVQAGGGSHLVAFVGHNGLMDFPPPAVASGAAAPARAAMVLACASRPYFSGLLARGQAYPVLLTTGLMAPEAYSLEAAVRVWFASADVAAVRQAAAEAYNTHQGCGVSAAKRLFSARQ